MADAVAVPWRFYIGKLHVFLTRLEDHDDRAMSVPSVSVILGMSQRSAILVNVCDCFDHQIWAAICLCVPCRGTTQRPEEFSCIPECRNAISTSALARTDGFHTVDSLIVWPVLCSACTLCSCCIGLPL